MPCRFKRDLTLQPSSRSPISKWNVVCHCTVTERGSECQSCIVGRGKGGRPAGRRVICLEAFSGGSEEGKCRYLRAPLLGTQTVLEANEFLDLLRVGTSNPKVPSPPRLIISKGALSILSPVRIFPQTSLFISTLPHFQSRAKEEVLFR